MMRLMIVDDEEIIREALAEMIDYEALGYTLIAAAKNGMEAYDLICDEYPDVVITDIRMPGLDGLGLIERAMKADARITFILLSGYNEFEYAKQAMRYGVRYYLLKPTDKNELIEVLQDVRQERTQEEARRRKEQESFLRKMRLPLEECFVKEAVELEEPFPAIFRKYQPLLSFPETGLAAFVCSFVEESFLKKFAADVYRSFSGREELLAFPILYVRENAVLILKMQGLAQCERVKTLLGQLWYPGQCVALEIQILHGDTAGLFENVFAKIARFEQIRMLDAEGEERVISHRIASDSRIEQLSGEIRGADEARIPEILKQVFVAQMPIETARNLALGLFLKWNPVQAEQPLDIACDFFRKLYNCTEVEEIRDFVRQAAGREEKRNSSNIALVKTYVERHYGEEYLSLKWIAENYLFVSVGYLSKQFVKEEGIRFSDYLNRVRMDEAKRLMHFYHNENITDIACQVGFGNNPQYFRQVFKRYTGCTPGAYLKNIQK
ncbi:MAG: response regulator [Eubacteriales bacterium]|nr:response regulator [Eubacteriales bacterium]